MARRTKKARCLKCRRQQHARGLCRVCHNSWLAEIRKVPEDDRPEVEQQAINAGLLLPRRRPGRQGAWRSEFDELMAQSRG